MEMTANGNENGTHCKLLWKRGFGTNCPENIVKIHERYLWGCSLQSPQENPSPKQNNFQPPNWPLNSEPWLGKSKESNNQGIQVQVKRTFRNYIFITKKSRSALHETFPIIAGGRYFNSLFQNHCFLILFQRISWPPGQDQ